GGAAGRKGSRGGSAGGAVGQSAPAGRAGAIRFSRADRVGQRLPDWKTTAIRRARSSASSASERRARDRPSIRTSPAEGTSIADPIESIVLFPLPDGPTTAT